MSAKIIDGKAFALGLRGRLADAVETLKDEHNLTPGLAVVLVGEDPASQVYVRNKGLATRKAGMRSIEHRLPHETGQAQLIELIRGLNADPDVHGILVQLPLPAHIDTDAVINQISVQKDVDGLTYQSAGRLLGGADGLIPCTPQGCVMLIKDALGDLSGKNAVVLGRSILVGKPLALLLLAENCTVTSAHSRTRDLPALCREADILCAAVGRAEMVKEDWVKPGACVIDVGINRVERDGESQLVGDVDFNAAREAAGWITPVPGGVGPMTIACLLRNTVLAACRQAGVKPPESV